MRAPLSPLLLATTWLSAAWLAGAGCAAAPKEESQAAEERACTNDASDPLHMASSRPSAGSDPQIESILNQPADPRLAWINRQMYQSLHALDVELRREQRVAACEHPESSAPTLEAQSGNDAGAGGGSAPGHGAEGGAVAMGGGAGGGTAPSGGTGSAAAIAATAASGVNVNLGGATSEPTTPATNAASTTASAASQNPTVNAAAPGAARATSVRKSSLSGTGGGGNGATAPKITAGSDNDIVARRLRKAAEQETNPTLRAKLWKEYTDYRQGMVAK
jgi:hypothetical protein